MKLSGKTRMEHDLIGQREVPIEYYFGVQTLRAVENFQISHDKLYMYPYLIIALAEVKKAAALANNDLGLLSDALKDAISNACDEIKAGEFHEHFVVDMFQGGAGTSTNMNANEVIANRALELLGHQKGEYTNCHPNNHVNLSQSTNDAYPTSLQIALYRSVEELMLAVQVLVSAFQVKAEEFEEVLKMGRTQLQDAVPMTLGQEFNAFADSLLDEIQRLDNSRAALLEINMGATAIGTGINSDPDYPGLVLKHLVEITDIPLVLTSNMIKATSDTAAFVEVSSAIKSLAIKLSRISNDLRLLSSGPRAGLNEINLPAMQPGSTIMPGKVNPVIPELMNQIAFRVIGSDTTVTMASEAAQLQLNVMEPVIIYTLLENIELLINGMHTLTTKCVTGIQANKEVCNEMVMNSIGLVTALSPYLGYETCGKLASEALRTNRPICELVLEKELLDEEVLDDILKPENMVKPRKLV